MSSLIPLKSFQSLSSSFSPSPWEWIWCLEWNHWSIDGPSLCSWMLFSYCLPRSRVRQLRENCEGMENSLIPVFGVSHDVSNSVKKTEAASIPCPSFNVYGWRLVCWEWNWDILKFRKRSYCEMFFCLTRNTLEVALGVSCLQNCGEPLSLS